MTICGKHTFKKRNYTKKYLCQFSIFKFPNPLNSMKTLLFLLILFVHSPLLSGNGEQRMITDVGNIRLSISSFGTIGTGFAAWPKIPSCEYPRGSGIEHMFLGGLWVGGIKNIGGNQVTTVTTAALDVSSVLNVAQGFEFTNMDSNYLVQSSSLPNDLYYSPKATSHRDYVCTFTDTNLFVPELNQRIPGHEYPLGLHVSFKSYAWNFPFADYFVILTYTLKNVSTTPIDSAYIGFWTDLVIRNTTIRAPRGGDFYRAGGNALIDSMRMMYEWDISGDNGLADNYAAIRLLGTEPVQPATFYNVWAFQDTRGDEWLQSPQTDIEKYRRLSTTFLNQVQVRDAEKLIAKAGNRSQLLSVGPFSRIQPGDSVTVAFAVICAKKPGSPERNDDETRVTLINNAGWSQRAYNGTDVNGNNVLDSTEIDLKGDGSIVRYILPSPPPSPKMRVEVQDRKAMLYWSNNAESAKDILTNKKNFEGYRIYRTNPGQFASTSKDWTMLGSFDKSDNGLFYDNGFSSIIITDNQGNPSPKFFEGDSVAYHYVYPLHDLLNGWQYAVTLTAFSDGDEQAGLPSLESSLLANERNIIPGTIPNQADTASAIGIFPNPYSVSAAWDAKANAERGRKIYFYNLPQKATITIFTLAGDKVATMQHEQHISEGQDIQWFSQTGSFNASDIQFSGGIHAWDLISDADQALATGMYIVTVQDVQTGTIKNGTFLIIK